MKPFVLVISLLTAFQAAPQLRPDPPKVCADCESWNRRLEPFQVFGNTYYVGVEGLSSILIASDRGLILLDGALPQSAPRIAESVRALGFRIEDLKLIVNSHAHFDHAGGIAALQRASGAAVAASNSGKQALARGGPTKDDPQFGLGPSVMSFPPVRDVRAVADGETLRMGDLAITAHLTPGHTPGSTTWTWRSCEGSRCYDIVYADSLNPVSSDGFRFSGDATHPSIVDAYRKSIAIVEGLPCDILLTVHPGFTNLGDKLRRRADKPTVDPFVDGGCRGYAADARKRLDARLAIETGDRRR